MSCSAYRQVVVHLYAVLHLVVQRLLLTVCCWCVLFCFNSAEKYPAMVSSCTVVDLVEGTAMAALPFLKEFLVSFVQDSVVDCVAAVAAAE